MKPLYSFSFYSKTVFNKLINTPHRIHWHHQISQFNFWSASLTMFTWLEYKLRDRSHFFVGEITKYKSTHNRPASPTARHKIKRIFVARYAPAIVAKKVTTHLFNPPKKSNFISMKKYITEKIPVLSDGIISHKIFEQQNS